MPTRLEESLGRDIDRIRQQLLEMSALAERNLRDCVQAMKGGERARAYAVILRDQLIDEKEKEIDRLCLEFLVRQQPVGLNLRLAYSAIKINLELERVGDYAESIARQVLRLEKLPATPETHTGRLVEMADLAIPMIHDATRAFLAQDADLARAVVAREPAVDALLGTLVTELLDEVSAGRIGAEMLVALSTIGRRFERVADQARNVCMETLYMCTGQYAKHPGAETFRVLFVGEHNACRSQMAEAIGQSLDQSRFLFSSAGLSPRAIDPRTAEFLTEKGYDAARMAPKGTDQVPNLDYYNVIVGVAPEAQSLFPRTPRNLVYLDWSTADPSRAAGSPEEVRAAYQATYEFLERNIRDLVGAVLDGTHD